MHNMPRMKVLTTLSDMPVNTSRNTSYVLSSYSEKVQIIKNAPIFDNEGSWEQVCVVTGRKFSPIQVPIHFLNAGVCNGQAYKKLMEERKAQKKARRAAKRAK
jgi:hypothetical protein